MTLGTPFLRARRALAVSVASAALAVCAGCSGPVVAESSATAAPEAPLSEQACASAREIVTLQAQRAAVRAGDEAGEVAVQARMLNALAGIRGSLDIDRDGEYLDAVNILTLNLPESGGAAPDPLAERAVESSTATVAELVTQRC